MTKLFILFLLASGCATKVPLTGMKDAVITGQKVNNRTEALRLIQSKYNFLKLLFEQSRDPYYGKFKWSEECLKENVIGPVVETKTSIVMNSALYLDSKLESGFCPDNVAKRWNVILVWCEGDSELKEYKIPFQKSLLEGYFKVCQ